MNFTRHKFIIDPALLREIPKSERRERDVFVTCTYADGTIRSVKVMELPPGIHGYKVREINSVDGKLHITIDLALLTEKNPTR